jgi:hypothetical protein
MQEQLPRREEHEVLSLFFRNDSVSSGRGPMSTAKKHALVNLRNDHEDLNPSCFSCSSWFKNKTCSSCFMHVPK